MKEEIRSLFSGYCLLSVLMIFITSSYQMTEASQLKASTLKSITEGQEQSWGLFKHNEKSALIVATMQGRFGIHRYDLSDGEFETLKVIDQIPVLDPVGTPVPKVRFFKVNMLTFILVRGVLFSTDGSREGTQYIRDFGTRFVGGNLGATEVDNFIDGTNFDNDFIFFSSVYSANGREASLITSDGTGQGTRKLGGGFIGASNFFKIGDSTFFFATLAERSNLNIWQVSEGGVQLSSIPNTLLDQYSPGRVVVDGKKAFFCVNNKLAMFVNKKLSYLSDTSCDYLLEKNSLGVFYGDEANLYSLDTKSLKSNRIELPNSFGLSSQSCSTSDSLIFTIFDTEVEKRRLMSYNKSEGLKYGVFVQTLSGGGNGALECFDDRSIFQNDLGYFVFNPKDNSTSRVRGLSGDDFTSNAPSNFYGPYLSNIFDHQNRIYLLARQAPKTLADRTSLPIKLIEIIESIPIILPISILLLEEDST